MCVHFKFTINPDKNDIIKKKVHKKKINKQINRLSTKYDDTKKKHKSDFNKLIDKFLTKKKKLFLRKKIYTIVTRVIYKMFIFFCIKFLSKLFQGYSGSLLHIC